VLLDEPSPKFHDHDVGVPVEASVKVTVWPVVGELGEKVKAAVGAGVVGRVDWEGVPPPQPAMARQASKRNRSRRISDNLLAKEKYSFRMLVLDKITELEGINPPAWTMRLLLKDRRQANLAVDRKKNRW
jgi:hypothetical protein